jgi:hypothetical protein
VTQLNMIKLCVGCDSVADLEDWVAQKLKEKKRRRQKPEHIHTTRMSPKRADELIGGSLYWVIRGQVSCRERIVDLRQTTGKDGIRRCQIVMDGKIVPVEPRPYRAFQGWRYYDAKDAPRDLSRAGRGLLRMPEPMRRELRELGLL